MAIPTLSPQPPNFYDDNLNHIPPPLVTIRFPHGIKVVPELYQWKMVSPWYFSFSHQLYFDILSSDVSKRHRFQIKLNPDLSAASLHHINTSELFHQNHTPTFFQGYRICEDSLVSFWHLDRKDCGVYMGLMSARSSNFIITHSGPAVQRLLPDIGQNDYLTLCPASGRLVQVDSNNSVAVLDFF